MTLPRSPGIYAGEVHHPSQSERLRLAYCCGYDAVLVAGNHLAVLFAEGMYCG
ncbi:MAG: hypothetical protein HY909_07150 [Deltaproteobacteria bacterium]|nr:hypothetical protein [Deltaproteobacteria bacterium]